MHVVRDLYNRFAETDVTFSPDEKYILTGTSEQKESGRKGQLLFFDSQSLALKKSIGKLFEYFLIVIKLL